MDEKKNNKRQITKVFILVVALMVIAFSGTYAYFTNNFMGKPSETTVTSGFFDVESSLETTSAIRNRRMALIHVNDTQDQREELADKLTFTVTSTKNSTVDGKFNLFLKDIKLTKNLYTKYLKWELLKGTEIINSGDFENVERVDMAVEGEEEKVITDVKEFQLNSEALSLPKNTTQTYTFRMYLLDDPTRNQIELIDGSFNGRLYLEAVPVSALTQEP